MRKVLVLNSYHRGYDWSDHIVEAIRAEFDKTDLEVELFFEYMDTMRYEFDEAFRYMKQLCEAKYANADFDLIITTDDSALYFLLAHRDLLFPGIPVVFCGVQEAENSKPQNYDSVTGVLELYDYQSTAKIALKLHPSAKRIVAITDGSKADLLREMALDEVLQSIDRKVEVDVLSLGGRSMSGLLEKIEQLGSESILFLVSAFRDKEGVIYSRQESARMIRQRCKAPIYVTGIDWLGLGPVGGRVAYGAFQGQAAAKMAIRILNGEKPQNIPILRESPNAYMFDYIQLKHFGISLSSLPEESIIINQPQSLYYKYKIQIWLITVIIIILTTTVIILLADRSWRKKIEKALHKSEEKYRSLITNIPDVTWTTDYKGKTIFISQNVEKVYGYTPEEIYKAEDKLWLGRIHPKDIQKVKDAWNALFEKGIHFDVEYRIKRKDGQWIWLHDRSVVTYKKDGVMYADGVFSDITERKKVEEALRKSEEKYKKLFEETTDAIFVADAETGILTDCNRVAAELVGRVKSELVGKPQRILHPPQEIEGKFSMTFKQHLREKEGQVLEAKVITKKGEIKDVAIRASRFELRGRKLIQALFRDITERRKAEEALRQSEEKYRSVIENIGIGVTLISPKMQVLALNKQIRQWYPDIDVSKEPICYKAFNNPPRDNICPYCPTYKSIKDGKVHEAVTETPAGDKIINYRIISSPIKNMDGKVIAAIEMVEDITELTQRQQELSMYREKMARTEQLASLGTLSATLAHQLTQPLTVIRLSIENLLEDLQTASCPDGVIEELKDSLAGVSNAASIVERFKDFARKSSEKTLDKIELKTIVEKVIELLNENAKRAQLKILIKNMDKLPTIYLNERDVAQILFAIAENAIQAAEGKKPRRLIISADVKDEHIELQFQDDCGGIAPENLDRIFEPFFTTGSNGTRTGLGLSIVQRILSECGGKIRVESKFKKGTTFYVTLPIDSTKA